MSVKQVNGVHEYVADVDESGKQNKAKRVHAGSEAQKKQRQSQYEVIKGVPASPVAPDTLDETFEAFFAKCVFAFGIIPVRCSNNCSDDAIIEAAVRVERMLQNIPHIAARLASQRAEVHVLAVDQPCSDLPYLNRYKGTRSTDVDMDWDDRNRGTCQGLWASCAEENLLKLDSDKYRNHRDICVHEFGHTLMKFGVDQDIRDLIEKTYKAAIAKGKWATAYASTNAEEYFAELTMWFFGSRGDYGQIEPKPKEGAEWLKDYDSDGYKLMDDLYNNKLVTTSPMCVLVDTYAPILEFSLILKDDGNDNNNTKQVAVELLVFNNTGSDLNAYWLDVDGIRQPRGKSLAGEYYHYFTYSDDVLLLTDKNGQGKFIIRPKVRDAPLARCFVAPQVLNEHF